MSAKFKDRHLLGAGAAACAICCAPPLLALLGIALRSVKDAENGNLSQLRRHTDLRSP